MSFPGPAEIAVILVVALIVFGPKRLPEVGRQVGAAMRELRKMQDAVKAELAESRVGPPLTPDDLLDFHLHLAGEGWFEELAAQVRRSLNR